MVVPLVETPGRTDKQMRARIRGSWAEGSRQQAWTAAVTAVVADNLRGPAIGQVVRVAGAPTVPLAVGTVSAIVVSPLEEAEQRAVPLVALVG
jgi:hypothetical protein